MVGSGYIEFKLDYEQIQQFEIGDDVSSASFSAGGHLWRINCACYPFDADTDGNEYLALYLALVSKAKEVKAVFDAFLVDRDGNLFCRDDRGVDTFKEGGAKWGWDRFVKRSDLELYVTNGTVTFVCGVIVMPDSTLPVLPPSDLPSHLGHLLDCTLGTDVSFTVDGETFHAHRAVLAARSPVFSAVLFGPMADTAMSSITLQDIQPATFKVMLGFMYTDTLPPYDDLGDSPVEMLQHVLAAADRFALDCLKVLCELKLWHYTSVMTVASVLACAERYNCLKLKTKCMDFFAVQENFYKAVFTDGFAMLLQKFPALAAELRKRVGKGNKRIHSP